ncbi:ACT domain-containing protein [Cellulosilyticum sp. I15G10I2]|uniref:ACT domain-containing protein n=1 Tax=Cellulosilyticum sp. I15G10I2 TaxID=1892843 RepID=UPI00085CB466|nr:ACT domain-containing protein [Cellulosilyticum sp. I15G10I2]
MKEKHQFYVIGKDVLPEIFLKVVEAKKLLEKNTMLTVQEATEQIGISRSSFYKYKDSIFPFYDKGNGQAITMLIHLQDEPGILSDVLNHIASVGGNVLTINQMVPMNGIAIINLCMQTANMIMNIEEFINELETLRGVQQIKILARE